MNDVERRDNLSCDGCCHQDEFGSLQCARCTRESGNTMIFTSERQGIMGVSLDFYHDRTAKLGAFIVRSRMFSDQMWEQIKGRKFRIKPSEV